MLAKCYQYIQNIQNNQYQEYFSISTIRDILVISASVAVIYAVVNQNVSANESKENLNTEASVAAGANVIRSYDYKKFNWAFYQSPANPVFFDEGEGHIPPRPYIYLAQNPTLENAIKLQEWQRKKMEVTNQVTQLLLEASKPIDMKKLTSLDPVSFNNYLTSKNSTNKNVISEKNDALDLKVLVYDEIHNEEKECSICLSEFEKDSKVSLISCNHLFHNECIKEWSMYKQNCPICRKKIE